MISYRLNSSTLSGEAEAKTQTAKGLADWRAKKQARSHRCRSKSGSFIAVLMEIGGRLSAIPQRGIAMGKLDGKVAIVTGAAGGLGRSYATTRRVAGQS